MLFPLSPSGGGVRGAQVSHRDVLGLGGQRDPGLSQ